MNKGKNRNTYNIKQVLVSYIKYTVVGNMSSFLPLMLFRSRTLQGVCVGQYNIIVYIGVARWLGNLFARSWAGAKKPLYMITGKNAMISPREI